MIKSNPQATFELISPTHRLHSSSFLGLPYRILHMNPKKGTTMEPMGKASNDTYLDPTINSRPAGRWGLQNSIKRVGGVYTVTILGN